MNTPIQKLDFPNDRNVRLYCKREDLLPFSLGGNKVRIGRAFYNDMLEKGKDCMIVYCAVYWQTFAAPTRFRAI